MKRLFPMCTFEDFIADLPSQTFTILSVLLPCITLWLNRPLMRAHPELVALLPLLLAHASYMALGVYAAIHESKKLRTRRSWPRRMRHYLRIGTFGATPFAVLILLLGLFNRTLRPFSVIAAFTVVLSTVIAILFITSLTYVMEEMHRDVDFVGGPLAAASMFGVVITTYLMTSRILYRKSTEEV